MATLHRYYTIPLAPRNLHVTPAHGKAIQFIMPTPPQELLEEDRTICLTNFTSLLGYYTLGNSHGLSNNSSTVSSSDTQSPQPQGSPLSSTGDGGGAMPTATDVAKERIKGDSGSAIRSNGGAGSTAGFAFDLANAGRTNGSGRVLQYLYRDDDDPIGGAICSFPSMEIQLPVPEPQRMGHGAGGGPPPLANITVSNYGSPGQPPPASSVPATVTTSDQLGPLPGAPAGVQPGRAPPDPQIPAMSASIYDLPTSSPPSVQPSSSASPTRNNTTNSTGTGTTDPNDPLKPPTEEHATIATSLSTPTIWTRSSLPQAPPALLRSLASSFSSLVDSRVQAWTLFLLRHSLCSNTGDKENRGFLLDMLETRTSIEVVAAVTTFTVTKEGRGELREEVEKRRRMAELEGGGKKKGRKMEDCDLVLPLKLEVVMDVSLQGRKLTVRFSAMGHIAAIFHEDTSLITYAECKVDSKEFTAGMIEQTRLVLLEAVKSATSTDPKVKPTPQSNNIQVRGPNSPASTPATSFTKLTGAYSTASISNMSRKASLASSSSIGRNLMQSMQNLQRAQQQQQQKQGRNDFLEQRRNSTGARASAVKITKSSLLLSSLLTSRLDLPSTEGGNESGLGSLKKKPSVVWKQGGDTIHNMSKDNTPSCSTASSMASLQGPLPPTSLKNDWPDRIVKRQKLGAEVPSMKRSVKSFGKPDANDFCSVKNATFAEFGVLKNLEGGGRRPEALQKARQQAFGLRRSGSSNAQVVRGTGNGMLGVGRSMNALNATFDRNMKNPLAMSNGRTPASVSDFLQRQQQQLGQTGQKVPIGALGDLSLGKLRSQKSAQFDRMLTLLQNRDNSNPK